MGGRGEVVDALRGGVVVVRDGDVLAETLAEFVLAERGAHGGHRAARKRDSRGVRRRGVRTNAEAPPSVWHPASAVA